MCVHPFPYSSRLGLSRSIPIIDVINEMWDICRVPLPVIVARLLRMFLASKLGGAKKSATPAVIDEVMKLPQISKVCVFTMEL